MSKQNSKKPALPGSTVTMGLDIGYGVVKAVTADQVVMFPSVTGHAREIKFQQEDLAQRHPGDQITDDEGNWFVGDLALAQLPTGELLRLRGRTANESTMGNAFRLRLAKVAIGKLMQGMWNRDIVHIRIATGLPTDHMRDATELKTSLLGQHLIKTDTADLIANITEVMVMPQPYGTIFANTLTDTGEVNRHHAFRRTGVCDVGTYTVDLALDDEGEFVDAESGSVESGVYTAQERIAAALERDYREKMPFKIVEEVLRTGIFHANGQPVDYRDIVQEALAPLRSATLNLISEKWQRGTTVDVVYLSGGGAAFVVDDVRTAYPQSQLVSGAQLANAYGYLNSPDLSPVNSSGVGGVDVGQGRTRFGLIRSADQGANRMAKQKRATATVKMTYSEDADLIAWWNSVPRGSRNAVMKDLMRDYIDHNQGGYRPIYPRNMPQPFDPGRFTQICDDAAWIRTALMDLPGYVERVIQQVAVGSVTPEYAFTEWKWCHTRCRGGCHPT